MILSLFLFHDSLINIVAITFTALVACELLNVAFETHTCNKYMVLSELVTVLVYFSSMLLLRSYFGMITINITFMNTITIALRPSSSRPSHRHDHHDHHHRHDHHDHHHYHHHQHRHADMPSPDIAFIATWEYVWRVVAVTVTSSFPLYVFEFVHRKWNPPAYDKLA